jgi:hypothetical protein
MPKFPVGQIVATPGAVAAFPESFLTECFQKHSSGDWGDTPKEDAKMNNEAMTTGDRIMSSYKLGSKKLWVITEGEGPDRVTTFLLPSDY